MKLNIETHEKFVFAAKPSGVSTHSPGNERIGFVEYLSERFGEKLSVVHRLDKDTSGVMVFARANHAASITRLFEEQQVRKRYLFITDRPRPDFTSREAESRIEKAGADFHSLPTHPFNAKTQFTFVRSIDDFSLWEACPSTGRTHQIRLHAKEIGLPILGDNLYGGSRFPRLCLHAEEIQFTLDGISYRHQSDSLFLSANSKNIFSLPYAGWIAGLEIRQALFLPEPEETYRILHSESTWTRCDKLGEVAWFYWYHELSPSQRDQDSIHQFQTDCGASHSVVSLMSNRGALAKKREEDQEVILSSSAPSQWEVTENGMRFLLRSNQGKSPGLFLDQRESRKWVRNQAAGKRVLNLFSYTGGFSIAAALGGASEVYSVDTSKASLQWGEENARLNGIESTLIKSVAMDAREALRMYARQQKQFDLVICDPPSFARSKGKIFSLEKDFIDLLEGLLSVKAPGGIILFSTNLQQWTQKDLNLRLQDFLPNASITQRLPDWDFGFPGDDPLLKTVVIQDR